MSLAIVADRFDGLANNLWRACGISAAPYDADIAVSIVPAAMMLSSRRSCGRAEPGSSFQSRPLRVESQLSPAGQRRSPTISPSHLQFPTDCSLGTVISPSSEGAEPIAFSAATRIPRRARGLPGVDK